MAAVVESRLCLLIVAGLDHNLQSNQPIIVGIFDFLDES